MDPPPVMRLVIKDSKIIKKEITEKPILKNNSMPWVFLGLGSLVCLILFLKFK